jgi:site-specific recombinase XerD
MAAMKTVPTDSPIDGLVSEYHHHLLRNAGFTSSTCRVRTFFIRAFLNALFQTRAPELDLQKITAGTLLDYVLQQSHRWSPQTVQSLASALRSFCRYLCSTGRAHADLTRAIPAVCSNQRDRFPNTLTTGELGHLLGSCKGKGPAQKRDYAVLLCLAKLGLRAGEAAKLRLEDIDWHTGTLRLVATKGRRERLLPLSSELGGALASYLRHERPSTAARTVFVSLLEGRSLSSEGISAIASSAFKRAGISGRRGSHRLRHTVASHLVQRGASLKAVADLLGHGDLATTQIYAKVNLPLLRQVAMPWPKEAQL